MVDGVQALWQAYCEAAGEDPSSLGAVERFGDSAEMANELLGLVLAGTKTATAGLARDYAETGEPLPEPGGHWIAVDGHGVARCVLRTVEIRLGTLGTVDEDFARDEGEGDRSRAWWLDAHRQFFVRQYQHTERPFDEEQGEVVFECFQLVWPPGWARKP